jgi:putative transposase
MRKSKFTESQIVGIIKEAEADVPVPDLLRRHGVSRASFFLWRRKYAGVAGVKRLRELEAENAKLKRMYADLALENAAIKDVLSRKLQRRPPSDSSSRCSSTSASCPCSPPVAS